MSSNTTIAHRERVLADRDVLSRVKMRLEQVRRSHGDAQAQLLDVQRAVVALASEERELESLEQALASSLEQTQAALLTEYVARLPDDIWRCVFEEAVRDETTFAFIVAGVCIRWRRIALSSPFLWKHISLPGGENATHAVLARQCEAAKLMLSRSGTGPLDIWIWPYQFQDYDERITTTMRDILALFAAQASRWHTAALFIPGRVGRGVLAALKGPTPALVELTIIVDKGDLWAPDVESGYLPYAPRLKFLILSGAAMGSSGISEFPALESARITSQGRGPSIHQVFGFLGRAGESLRELEVPGWFSGSDGTTRPLLLPQLQTLVVGLVSSGAHAQLAAIPALTLLSTPRLTHLTLDHKCITAAPLPFLSAVSQTVTSLKLFEELTLDSLEHLAHLQNIERLEFGIGVETLDATGPSLNAAVCDALASRVPPIWPQLAEIDLQHAGEIGGDSLLKVITARNVVRPGGATDTETATRPCRLCKVTLSPDVPRWIREEVQRMLTL